MASESQVATESYVQWVLTSDKCALYNHMIAVYSSKVPGLAKWKDMHNMSRCKFLYGHWDQACWHHVIIKGKVKCKGFPHMYTLVMLPKSPWLWTALKYVNTLEHRSVI